MPNQEHRTARHAHDVSREMIIRRQRSISGVVLFATDSRSIDDISENLEEIVLCDGLT
jgi:hypothetical protein